MLLNIHANYFLNSETDISSQANISKKSIYNCHNTMQMKIPFWSTYDILSIKLDDLLPV